MNRMFKPASQWYSMNYMHADLRMKKKIMGNALYVYFKIV